MFLELKKDDPNVTQYTDENQIVCKEKHSEYRAEKSNDDTAYRYKIDGGIVRGNDGEKCDYVVENESKKHLYFVELKGSDFPKACSQIAYTIKKRYRQQINGYRIHARIVLSRVCTQSVKTEKYRYLKKCCPDTEYQSGKYEEKI